LNGGDHCWFKRSTGKKRPVTRHSHITTTTTTTTIIIEATGIVTRSLRKYLEAVPGKHLIDSRQKTAILGTSHIIQKVLQCEA